MALSTYGVDVTVVHVGSMNGEPTGAYTIASGESLLGMGDAYADQAAHDAEVAEAGSGRSGAGFGWRIAAQNA